MNLIILALIAAIVGTLIPLQAAANAGASKYLGDVSYAVLLSFIVGTIIISLYILFMKPNIANGALTLGFPKYILLGGCISAIYTIAITYLSPKLGVGNTLYIILVGQMLMALVVDHFGILGAMKHELTLSRVSGVVLILIGLYLTKKT
jgi:transporter family-2 protein